ncbi:unnamed protein product [Schistocephalus solidus]|uniref:Pesticidal crystal protein n=1 Tax=Schistocephalus solidus TaxID=70667 RepID=A0A183TBH9_SCHSO|nr:unnamed protein product [Schistocephalus solidus]
MGNSHFCGLNPSSDDNGTTEDKRPINRFIWRPKQRQKPQIGDAFGEIDDKVNSYDPSVKCDEATNRVEAGTSGGPLNRGEEPQDHPLFINTNNNISRIEDEKTLPHEVTVSREKYSYRGVNTGALSIQYNQSRSINQTDLFIRTIRNWIPGAAHMENLLKRRFHRGIPYISGTALGFSRLKKDPDDVTSWLRPRRKVEHWMKFRTGSFPSHNSTLLKSQSGTHLVSSRGRCEKLKNEKEGWWRYTMFIPQDPLDKSLIERGLNENGGYLVGLESRFGCEIKFTEKIYVYRANVVRLVVIDGPSKKAILKCKSALPAVLRKDLIQDYENCLITDQKSPAPRLEFAHASLPPSIKVN